MLRILYYGYYHTKVFSISLVLVVLLLTSMLRNLNHHQFILYNVRMGSELMFVCFNLFMSS